MAINVKKLFVHIPEILTTVNKNMEHVGTVVQVAEQTDFDTGTLLVNKTFRKPNDDILHMGIDIEFDETSNIYVRYALIFKNTTTQEEIKDGFSCISNINSDQEGYKFDNIIVSTPYITTEMNTSNIDTNSCKINIDGFQVLSGVGKHKYTSWLITDANGVEVFRRDKDEDNLTSILIDYSLFESTKLYQLRAKFVTDTNGYSNLGTFVFNTQTTEKFKYDLEPIKPFYYGQSLFYKATYKVPNITNVALVVKEVLSTGVEKEVYRKENYSPSRSLEVPSTNLVEGATYKVYSYVTMRLNGNIVKTSATHYDTFTYFPQEKYTELVSADYPGKYTKLTSIVTGGMVCVSRELKNKTFVISKNSNQKFSIFARYGNTIRDTGLEIEIPDIIDSKNNDSSDNNYVSFVPYVNVLPLYNDIVLINYCTFVSGTYKKSIWAAYKPDLATNKWTLLNKQVMNDELYSTAMNSSAVVAKDNSVYYIPARYEPTANTPALLPLFKMIYDVDANTFTRKLVKENLINGVYRNLTMCPTGNQSVNQEEFLILGGTNHSGTDITTGGSDYTGEKQYVLSNKNIYKFKCSTADNVGDGTGNALTVVGSLPTNFEIRKYSLSAFYRRDGKIVVFNNSDEGVSNVLSATFTLDLTKTGTEMYKDDANESTIDLAFRSTIISEEGDFLRVSYTTDLLSHILLYPHVKLASYTDASITINKNLVVPVGRTISIENPYLYDTITIEGTADDNTGILKWTDQNLVRTLTWRDRILTRDTTLTQAEADTYGHEHLWVLDGVKYTVKG